ncbi:MAG: hypothetical protein CMJ58_06185 [Planctomycetaceae bacterium]|nr:hypothetical protein [Planctomycetaceae bacterium]
MPQTGSRLVGRLPPGRFCPLDGNPPATAGGVKQKRRQPRGCWTAPDASDRPRSSSQFSREYLVISSEKRDRLVLSKLHCEAPRSQRAIRAKRRPQNRGE